jgi:hypothetical protein
MTEEIERRDRQREALEQMIAREAVAEERVRKAAILAWSFTFAVTPMLGIAFFLGRTAGGLFIEAVRAFALILLTSGTLSLFLPILMTVAWLFRSRAPTLAAIEQRLAALERILTERE